MILVDSCVWIDFFKGRETPEVQWLDVFRVRLEPEICLSGIVYFEVLRGIRDLGQRKRTAEGLKKLERRDFKHSSYDEMLMHELKCRKNGITLSKLGDWLIVQTLLDHDLELLSSDQDFRRILPFVPIRLFTPEVTNRK